MITNVTNAENAGRRASPGAQGGLGTLDPGACTFRPAPVACSIARLEEVERHLASLRARRDGNARADDPAGGRA
jgi:hypothetical protein